MEFQVHFRRGCRRYYTLLLARFETFNSAKMRRELDAARPSVRHLEDKIFVLHI